MKPDEERRPRFLIVNADDFGASDGINRGIVDCHRRGIVTSTSLMVKGCAAREAAAMSRDNSSLSLGLHFDVTGEDEQEFDLGDAMAVGVEFQRQLEAFDTLTGRLPTHIDSHRHVHMRENVLPIFLELAEPIRIPVRGDGRVKFVGGFYAQWEWMVTNLEYVSVDFLASLLREEVLEGWTELSCHPGYTAPGFSSVYSSERETEVATLTDARSRDAVERLGITLASFADYVRADADGNERSGCER